MFWLNLNIKNGARTPPENVWPIEVFDAVMWDESLLENDVRLQL